MKKLKKKLFTFQTFLWKFCIIDFFSLLIFHPVYFYNIYFLVKIVFILLLFIINWFIFQEFRYDNKRNSLIRLIYKNIISFLVMLFFPFVRLLVDQTFLLCHFCILIFMIVIYGFLLETKESEFTRKFWEDYSYLITSIFILIYMSCSILFLIYGYDLFFWYTNGILILLSLYVYHCFVYRKVIDTLILVGLFYMSLGSGFTVTFYSYVLPSAVQIFK